MRKSSVKFYLDSSDFEFVKVAALLQKTTISEMFRQHAKEVAQNARIDLKKRVGEMDGAQVQETSKLKTFY